MYVAQVNRKQQQQQQKNTMEKQRQTSIQVASDVDKWHLRNIQNIEMINFSVSAVILCIFYISLWHSSS